MNFCGTLSIRKKHDRLSLDIAQDFFIILILFRQNVFFFIFLVYSVFVYINNQDIDNESMEF